MPATITVDRDGLVQTVTPMEGVYMDTSPRPAHKRQTLEKLREIETLIFDVESLFNEATKGQPNARVDTHIARAIDAVTTLRADAMRLMR